MKDDIYAESLKMHEKYKGKIGVQCRIPLETKKDLSLAYTPGVAQPCIEIHKNPENVYKYTCKGNMVAVVTDGSAVLGLGDIGPMAALPVMEGKSILFKKFADLDAVPICLDTKNTDEIVNIVQKISPVFGGILLEDIAAPRCFEIEERLEKLLDIPVFHDDQHGTAIVVGAALRNCLKLVKRKFQELTIVINGAGAAGIAIAKLLKQLNVGEIILCDTSGIIYENRKENMAPHKADLAKWTNRKLKKGSLEDAMKGSDVFIGVSKADCVTENMIKSMNKNPMIFALANPVPEIMPDVAKKAGAMIVATGRSDFPNQVNNALVFPGLFRGALNARAKSITPAMKLAAVVALSDFIETKDLTPDNVLPKIFEEKVPAVIAKAVEKAAKEQKEGNSYELALSAL